MTSLGIATNALGKSEVTNLRGFYVEARSKREKEELSQQQREAAG